MTRLDPQRESAWKKLGYEKQNGRWVSTAEVKAARAEADAQRKADAHWRPLLLKWKTWLGQDSRRAEAEAALAAVDDPRAVPAIWRVFAHGGPADQERAIDMLGRLEGDRPARALAGLAIYGKNEVARRAAIATLVRRPHDDSLMVWIGLLREPARYEVRQVAGPGSPGILFVEGQRFNVRRFYSPPSVEQTEILFLSPEMGRPVLPLQFGSAPPGLRRARAPSAAAGMSTFTSSTTTGPCQSPSRRFRTPPNPIRRSRSPSYKGKPTAISNSARR